MRILSGVFTDEASGEQVTTGTPIALEIENMDARSKDYSEIKDKFRPGHADYTYLVKYGLRDWRGSGRASARETASRVAAGAIARKVVPGMRVRGALGAGRAARHRPPHLGLVRGRAQPVLLSRRQGGEEVGRLPRQGAEGGLVRAAPSSRSWPKACLPGSARRSTASSTRISLAG